MNYIDYIQKWLCTISLSYCVHKATVIPFTATRRIPCTLKHEGWPSSVLSDNWVMMLWPFVSIPSAKSRHVNSWSHLLDPMEYYLVSRNQMGKQYCMTIRRSWMQIIQATEDISCIFSNKLNNMQSPFHHRKLRWFFPMKKWWYECGFRITGNLWGKLIISFLPQRPLMLHFDVFFCSFPERTVKQTVDLAVTKVITVM